MAAMLRRLPGLAALAALAGIGAELLGHCAFTRLVRRKLPDGDLDYIDVTITELHYDAGAAGPAPKGGAR